MKTNLQYLLDGAEKARTAPMTVFKNGKQDDEGFIVISDGKGYIVDVQSGKIMSCTCPHHEQRRVPCKHMMKVSFQESLNIIGLDQAEPQDE